MAAKAKITLTQVDNAENGIGYVVASTQDSVDYAIGQQLSKSEVQRLCESPLWTVTVNQRRFS